MTGFQPVPLPPDRLEAILNSVIMQHLSLGWRIESRIGNQAVLVRGTEVNHPLHAVITVLVCGLWLPVWLIAIATGSPQRSIVSVDPYGRVMHGGMPFVGMPVQPPRFNQNAHAIQLANMRRDLRLQARNHARDVVLARDLRIGRPDLPRQYDDGGLVDINHVPAPVMTAITGITPELAERIVQIRNTVYSFTSAEELAVVADLPPHLTPELVEYAIFIP
ncbi:MAG: helix-hairpin-helix domain-containing protein [Streptosporangiaceae bacterium]